MSNRKKNTIELIKAYIKLVTIPIWLGVIMHYLILTEGYSGYMYLKSICLLLIAYVMVVYPVTKRVEKLIIMIDEVE